MKYLKFCGFITAYCLYPATMETILTLPEILNRMK